MTLVDQFKQKMASDMISRDNGGNDVWPAPVVDLDASVMAIAPSFLSNLSDAFSQLNLPDSAECFQHPSAVAQLMYLFMDRPHDLEDGRQRLAVAQRMLEIVDLLRNGDGLCLAGTNRTSSEAKDRRLQPIDSDCAVLLGRLTALLGLYVEYTYFAYTAFGREVHGPYGDSSSTIVRDYFDLAPRFWNFPRDLGFDKARLQIAYGELTPSFDFMGRLSTTESLPTRTTAAALTVDGREVDLSVESLEAIITSVSRALRSAQSETLDKNEDELFRQLVRAKYWACRRLFDRSGLTHLSPVEEDVVAEASHAYSIITRQGHSPLSRTLQQVSRLPAPARNSALQRLVDPAELVKYI